LLLSISHELRTKAYSLVSENWSFAWRACMKRLDETKRSETRDETPRPFGPRPRRDRDVEHFVRDRDVSTSRDGLETETSRPRPHPWHLYNSDLYHCIPSLFNQTIFLRTLPLYIELTITFTFICTIKDKTHMPLFVFIVHTSPPEECTVSRMQSPAEVKFW